MKTSIFFSFLISGLLATEISQAQTASCCSKPKANCSTEAFAMLGKDEAFQTAHLAPEPISFTATTGKAVSFKTPDGKTASAFEVKGTNPKKVVLMVHEWWGLNDHIRQEAEALQARLGDATVLALDLYDGKTAQKPEDAGKLMGEVKAERAEAIVKGALAYIDPKADVYTIGWCFGGGWSLQSSLLAGKRAKGCVIYYGQPEKDKEKLKKLASDVFFVGATQDKWISPEVITSFETDCKALGKNVTVKMYDADHAFANPSNPQHNAAFSKEAMDLVVDFLKKHGA